MDECIVKPSYDPSSIIRDSYLNPVHLAHEAERFQVAIGAAGWRRATAQGEIEIRPLEASKRRGHDDEQG
jgi:hypothetical protein